MTAIRTEHLAEGVTLMLGDNRTILPTLDGIDVVITDAPYSDEVHTGARGKGATSKGRHVLVDFTAISEADFLAVAELLPQVARRWVVVNCAFEHANAAKVAGLPVVRLGVWTKADPAPQFSGDRPGTGWESIVFMHRKGAKRWNGGGRSSVWHTKIAKNEARVAGEKPIELVADFVRLFSDPGELVLDPFLGSGTTGVAAVREGRRFMGIEVLPKHFDIACRRISDELRRPRLFTEKPPAPVQASMFAGE